QKRRGQKCAGPLETWLALVTRWPLVVAFAGVAVTVGLSFLGWRASNYTVDVDWDVASYMQTDSDVAFMSQAVDYAVEAQKATLENDAETRRLESGMLISAQAVEWWSLAFYYTATGDNVFTPAALAEIQGFEQAVQQFPGYSDYCFKGGGVDCRHPESVVNMFHPSVSPAAEDGYAFVSYDGLGNLADINSTLRAMMQQGVYWWVDADFDARHLKSKSTRSLFRGGVPLEPQVITGSLVEVDEDNKKHASWLRQLFDKHLISANDKFQHITVTWHEPSHLSSHEVIARWRILLHDVSWALGSFIFVAVFLVIQTRSLILAMMAISSICISFTTAFYFYAVVAGFPRMYLVN
ncbi:unnamed protein product, partial [Prorocentrum cordatum]